MLCGQRCYYYSLQVHAGLRGTIAYVLILILNEPISSSSSADAHHHHHHWVPNKSLSESQSANGSSAANTTSSLLQYLANNATISERASDPSEAAAAAVSVATFRLFQTTTLFIIVFTVFGMVSMHTHITLGTRWMMPILVTGSHNQTTAQTLEHWNGKQTQANLRATHRTGTLISYSNLQHFRTKKKHKNYIN